MTEPVLCRGCWHDRADHDDTNPRISSIIRYYRAIGVTKIEFDLEEDE